MAFHDVQLPASISRNYVGGAQFSTTISQPLSGLESRNINWSRARNQWRLGYPLDPKRYKELIDFFYCRAGKGHSFRHKNWIDYKLGDTLTDTRQSIGTGDGSETEFQIFKRYSSGGIDYDRVLTKIVDGTTRLFVNDIEQVAGWSVNLLTGLMTINAPQPALGHDVAVLAEFDDTVRFDTDQLDISMLIEPIASIPNIPIIEVKGE